MNIWPRSEALRAHVKFRGQSLSQGHYQPTYHQARKGFRLSSDAELFMSRTQFEFGPSQINKSTPVDSDTELTLPSFIQFEPKLLVKPPKTETAFKIRYNNLCITFGT